MTVNIYTTTYLCIVNLKIVGTGSNEGSNYQGEPVLGKLLIHNYLYRVKDEGEQGGACSRGRNERAHVSLLNDADHQLHNGIETNYNV